MPADDQKFGFVFRDAIIVGVFGMIFAPIFFSSDIRFHFIYGLWCSFICLAGFFHAPAHYFSSAKPGKKICVWIAYWCVLFLIAGWFSRWSYKIYHFVPESPPTAITLEVGPVLDSKDPFGTVLIINNESRQIISNVIASATWHWTNSENKDIYMVAGAMNGAIIAPHAKQGLHFANAIPIGIGQKKFIHINVWFTPLPVNRQTNESFQFCVSKDADGNFVWVPAGAGRNEAQFEKEMAK